MESNNDIKIWDAFRGGDDAALTDIFYKYAKDLYRYGSKFSKDSEFVKDAIQELFFELIKQRDNLGPTDNILFYLFASLRRKIAKQKSNNTSMDDPSMGKVMEAEIVYSFEDEMMDNEVQSRREKAIKEGLEKLTSKQREILYYKFTCDFTYDEICELMSLKYNSARKQVSRSLSSLKEALNDSDTFIFFLARFLKRRLSKK
ncbi:sigma-70 family RNA polymerase sigma factor [Puteibacter caeruleilacunae]|nr:sigma-70 family RNA polymerase sigma factor [Puteibacter caeruleilacunae]